MRRAVACTLAVLASTAAAAPAPEDGGARPIVDGGVGAAVDGARASGDGGVGAMGDGGADRRGDAQPTDAQRRAYFAAERLYRDGRYDEALAALERLIREGPRRPVDGALGLVVAAVATETSEAACRGKYAAIADAHPDDALDQYIAGVAAHYCGHNSARSGDEKAAYYRTAIRYLTRVLPAYDFEPRVYVYLAVSHHRLGEEAEARAFVDRAVHLARKDPDVWYCDAEIWAAADPARAIDDIRKYLVAVDELHHNEGVPVNAQKHARVESMLAQLEAVRRGEATLDPELWDPVLRPHQRRWGRAIGLAGGVVALALAIVWAARRRRVA